MSPTKHPPHKKVSRFFKRLWRREDGGAVTIEAILMLPLLFWGMWSTLSYFDGYRQSSRNLKATYALADIISRESRDMNTQYIDTMYQLLQAMLASRSDVSMRISFIRKDPDDGHVVLWSCERGVYFTEWNTESFQGILDRIPAMADDSTMILVEARDWYTRPFKTGFGDNSFPMENFIFTHPRGYTNINNPPCKVT